MSEKRQFFGTDGVRAVANRHPMTPEFVMRLAQAAAVVLGGKPEGGERPKAVLGRDTRASGEMLESALAAGLNSAGVDVILAGQLPTPAVAMLCAAARAAGGSTESIFPRATCEACASAGSCHTWAMRTEATSARASSAVNISGGKSNPRPRR